MGYLGRCEVCGASSSCVHVTEASGRESVLCLTCLSRRHRGARRAGFNFSRFVRLLGQWHDEPEDLSLVTVPSNQVCEECGTTYADFMQTGMAGCPRCYEVFESAIDRVLDQLGIPPGVARRR